MLLANMAVARKIYETFPESAVLRRHPPPQQKMVDELQELLQNLAMPVDFSSAKCIQVNLVQPVKCILCHEQKSVQGNIRIFCDKIAQIKTRGECVKYGCKNYMFP